MDILHEITEAYCRPTTYLHVLITVQSSRMPGTVRPTAAGLCSKLLCHLTSKATGEGGENVHEHQVTQRTTFLPSSSFLWCNKPLATRRLII